MGDKTSIAWVRNPGGTPGSTWNPILGCSHTSMACHQCYAERLAATRLCAVPAYAGLTKNGRWTSEVRWLPERLDQPLRWTHARGIFVADMSDLFHENLSGDHIAAIFGIMAACPQHTFYVLTKRANRMAKWFSQIDHRPGNAPGTALLECQHQAQQWFLPSTDDEPRKPKPRVIPRGTTWPLPNVCVGVTVEDMDTSHRLNRLREVPAALRFVSCEPLLDDITNANMTGLDWLIIGGDNGADAYEFNIDVARQLISKCRKDGRPVFLKQLGTRPIECEPSAWPKHVRLEGDGFGKHLVMGLHSKAGSNVSEWPNDLRVQEMHRSLP